MNKDKIMKALECCSNPSVNYCKDCPYSKNGKFSCRDGQMFKDALDLIIKQEKEIEYRKKQYDNQVSENTRLHMEYDKAFERLKAQQREIAELNAENATLKIKYEALKAGKSVASGIAQFANEINERTIKSKAVQEFAEKLKNYFEDMLVDEFGNTTIDIDEFKGYIDDLLGEYEK